MPDFEQLRQRLHEGDLYAARELGNLGTDQAIDILLQALDVADTVHQRRLIIQSLPLHPRVEPVLLAELRANLEYRSFWNGMIHLDVITKLTAFRSAAAVDAIRDWVQTVIALEDSYRAYAFEGLLALSDLGDEASLPLIRACLHDADPDLRSAAVHAAGKMRDVESIPVLINLLSDQTTDPGAQEWLICDAAADALSKIGDERAIQPILNLIETAETGIYPSIAIRALGRLSETGFDTLLHLLERAELRLQEKIIYSLGLIGNPRGLETLVAYIHDPRPALRQVAIEAIGHLNDPHTLPILIECLQNDEQPIVRRAAIHALTWFYDWRINEALIGALTDQSPWVINAAAAVLGERHTASAVEALIPLLADTRIDDRHQSVCDVAAKALRTIDTPAAHAALAQWR